MPILDGDIELLKSEILDDVPEGGGMATGAAVVAGASNNLFADISELDRTYGRLSLRKVFPAVVTDNVDTYFGAQIIVAEPPADPKVSATIFTTSSWSDLRSAAKDKLESYLAMGSEGRWMLYGNHLAGQRSLQLHCPHTLASPAVDDVLALVKRDDETVYQYVRVQRLISRLENVEFEDSKGIYYRDVITLELTSVLAYPFKSGTIERFTGDWFSPPTRIHITVAADAASYYGVQPLRVAAALGDLTIKAQSIYTQLVPSALAETPITDARCASDRTVIVPISGASAISFDSAIATAPGATAVRYFGCSIGRGTVQISIAGVTLADDSNGALVPASGFTGQVDYEAGSVSIARNTGISASGNFSASQAVAVASAGHTDATAITTTNRGYVYQKVLFPAPAPGTVDVSYMAQGKWYSLYDDGSGNISGDQGVGKGSVNYANGAVLLTLGALPDADTQIMFGWGSPTHYESHVGPTVFSTPTIRYSIPGGALQPASVTISYSAGAVEKTVTDNGAGLLSGDGSGFIDYASGDITLQPSVLPNSNSNIQIHFRQGGSTSEIHPASGALTNFSLAHTVMPGTLNLKFTDSAGASYTASDNGVGGLVFRSADLRSLGYTPGQAGSPLQSYVLLDASGIAGTVNYATGEVSLGVVARIGTNQQKFGFTAGYTMTPQTTVAAGNIHASYRVSGDSSGGVEVLSVALPPLTIDLLHTVTNSLVSSGLRFTLAGDVYFDRAGLLIKNPSPLTNSGIVAGSVNYTTGAITLSDYTGGGAAAIDVSALTRRGVWRDWKINFRTAGAPLQSASLFVRASRADTSETISGTGLSGGEINGAEVDGTIDYTTGIASVRFGNFVAVSSLTADDLASWWYSAANVVAGQIFKPILVLLDSARYNGVVTSTLPLSADILGLDPVRLPIDGRVPIFRKGYVAVVHHSASTAEINVSNNQTVALGRERLAKVKINGHDGSEILTGFSKDLDAGTVTFTNVTGYSQPVKIENRIEDMVLISDVQINGEIQIGQALTHDYPIGSHISSALIIGDMHARVSLFFDQATWDSWSDIQSGSAANGTYNKAQYPVVVTNRGAIEERWKIIFTNTGTISVIGETVGQIVTGHSITNTLAPINPAQNVPYFVIAPEGWGAGWAAGNVVRINTKAANYPVWIARTVLQGPASVNSDQFSIGVRGDVNAS